jgi:hypothetical protein
MHHSLSNQALAASRLTGPSTKLRIQVLLSRPQENELLVKKRGLWLSCSHGLCLITSLAQPDLAVGVASTKYVRKYVNLRQLLNANSHHRCPMKNVPALLTWTRQLEYYYLYLHYLRLGNGWVPGLVLQRRRMNRAPDWLAYVKDLKYKRDQDRKTELQNLV